MSNESTSAVFDSPVGALLARADAGTLTRLSFVDRSAPARRSTVRQGETRDVLDAVQLQIREYFEGRRKIFDVPMELRGSEFYRRAWAALREIPYGETISYGQLAARVGMSDAARAIGAANAANPIVIIVPCHRVIGADGSLVGYGGGLARKQLLLDLECGRVSFDF